MCNRVVQDGTEIKPGQPLKVLMRGPGGQFELPFSAVFGGPAKKDNRNYWIRREGAEDVLVPNVSRFGEKDKTTGAQNYEDVTPGSSIGRAAVANTAGEGISAAQDRYAAGDT